MGKVICDKCGASFPPGIVGRQSIFNVIEQTERHYCPTCADPPKGVDVQERWRLFEMVKDSRN